MLYVWIIGGLLLAFLLPVLLLRILSPGKTPPLRDEKGKRIAGSIAVIERPIIGGISQTLIIRGSNPANPVLLYLHGGPGTPEYAFIRREFARLEHHFTICYWEQRGAGKSATPGKQPINLTTDQLVADTAEVTRYLLRKFDQQQVYLLGHSWGSMLGVLAAQKHPELFAAYIGIGQVGEQYIGEQLSLAFVQEQARKVNHTSAYTAIEKLQLPAKEAPASIWLPYLLAQRKWVAEFGGALYRSNMNKTAPRQLITCPEYTLREKLNYIAASKQSILLLWETVLQRNLTAEVNRLAVPVFILQGRHDYQTPFATARAFFEQLEAPEKHWYTFEEAAHFPHTECYLQVEHVLCTEVLNAKA